MGSGTSLEYCDRTDVGRRRASNQDAKAVLEPWSREQYRRRGWLFVVADGMGAHAAGETASAMAAEQVPLVYEKHAARSPILALRTSIEQANAEINARGESSLDLKGMGTTCTVLAILPRGAIVGHVGDSRAYRVRGGTIEQLSKDHSLVWELEAAHTGSPDEMPVAPKNIITRSLGPHARVDVDLEGPFQVEENDVFVLCSDGLSGQVADDEVGLLAAMLPPKAAAAALVGLALVRGAPDNVTVIAAKAGEREVSRTAPGDEPWPLADEVVDASRLDSMSSRACFRRRSSSPRAPRSSSHAAIESSGCHSSKFRPLISGTTSCRPGRSSHSLPCSTARMCRASRSDCHR